jgi:hypothetical protein
MVECGQGDFELILIYFFQAIASSARTSEMEWPFHSLSQAPFLLLQSHTPRASHSVVSVVLKLVYLIRGLFIRMGAGMVRMRSADR